MRHPLNRGSRRVQGRPRYSNCPRAPAPPLRPHFKAAAARILPRTDTAVFRYTSLRRFRAKPLVDRYRAMPAPQPNTSIKPMNRPQRYFDRKHRDVEVRMVQLLDALEMMELGDCLVVLNPARFREKWFAKPYALRYVEAVLEERRALSGRLERVGPVKESDSESEADE